MAVVTDFFPSPEDFMEFETEELAVGLLRHMEWIDDETDQMLHLGNYFGSRDVSEYIDASKDPAAVRRKLTEAWVWLENEGMLAPLVEQGRDWVFVTGRGRSLLEYALLLRDPIRRQ